MSYLFKKISPYSLVVSAALLTFSCSNDAEDALNNEQDQKVDQTEIKTILETDQMSSSADMVVQDLFSNREAGKTAKDASCYTAEYSDTGFTVSFDDCSAEENGEILNGSLSVVYGTDNDSFAYTVIYDDLKVGGIGLDGTRAFTYSQSESGSLLFDVTIDMTLTLEDDKKISEKGSKTFGFVFEEEKNMFTIDGDWVLKSGDDTYEVDITSDLETEFACEYIGKGTMDLSKNGLEVSVDFGDGTCDDTATLIYPDSTVETISLKE
ncbi:hypothetical protein ZORO111903_13250 [Zobellia roscoffensis]|uniref:hypothetical protein n=1 Tax=Zobellia roscoffensis TaxID=2779508 RepID=UPI00188A936E|nr:hypothetical protein [Zobellia roscoffensis]